MPPWWSHLQSRLFRLRNHFRTRKRIPGIKERNVRSIIVSSAHQCITGSLSDRQEFQALVPRILRIACRRFQSMAQGLRRHKPSHWKLDADSPGTDRPPRACAAVVPCTWHIGAFPLALLRERIEARVAFVRCPARQVSSS